MLTYFLSQMYYVLFREKLLLNLSIAPSLFIMQPHVDPEDYNIYVYRSV